MLASKLNTLEEKGGGCRVKEIMASLNKDDARALDSAIRNPGISIRGIYGALRSEGIIVSRDSIAKGRDCATNPNACKCGAFSEGGKQ
jgi:hypothetical protein